MTSVNTCVTLLEAFFNIFLANTHTHTHIYTKALIYHCLTYTCRLMRRRMGEREVRRWRTRSRK